MTEKMNIPVIDMVLETTHIKTASRKLKVRWDVVFGDNDKMTLLEAGITVL